ncbi:MAG: 4Fe-4S binding protein, partial [Nitrospirota bacterium]
MMDLLAALKHIIEDAIEALKIIPWMQIWTQKWVSIVIFAAFLLLLIMMMVFKYRLAKSRQMLNIVAYGILSFSFIYVGLLLKAQPTTTNIVILVNGIKEGAFPLGLYIMEPFIFLSFLFIFLTIFLWGRGVFCGWLCPYGAMIELLNRLYIRVFPKFSLRLPEKIHWKLIYLKYVIFAIILGVSFYNFILSEYLAEIEPFKTFVLKLNRQWYFVLYFLAITAGSVIIYRAYCLYLCPLGAALSIPSFVRLIPLIKLKRHEMCGTCNICGKECSYQAITPQGKIKDTECLDCLECQINFWDEDRCPALIRRKKLENRDAGYNPPLSPLVRGKLKEGHRMLVLCLVTLLFIPSLAHAKTLIVGVDYPTISDALKKAKNGDVIEVKAGQYKERLKIDKAVYLKGINNPTIIENGGCIVTIRPIKRGVGNGYSTIIENGGHNGGHIVTIASRGVTMEGFTIVDENPSFRSESAGIYILKGADEAVIKNNRLHGVMHGVWSVGARGIRIENNTIESKKALERNYRGNGIYLIDSQEAIITGNRINYCRD